MIRRAHGVSGRAAALVVFGSLALASACKQQTGVNNSSGAPKFSAPSGINLTGSGAIYSLDFGQVAVGATASIVLALQNTGTSPMQILSVDAPGDAEFSSDLSVGTSIQSGGSVNVTLTFKPFGDGSKTTTLVVHTDSSATSDVTLNLTGEGVYLKLTATPQTLDFGSVVIHSSPNKTVTLANASTLDIQVTPSAISGSNANLFTIDKTTVFTVPANSSVDLSVTYSPVVPSAANTHDTAAVDLALSEGGSIHVAFQGIGLQSGLVITPTTLNFAFVQPGASETLSLNLKNVGNESIQVTSVSITDPGTPPAFAVVSGSWSSGTLAPGASQNVQVVFSPPVKDLYTGALAVSSTDSSNIVPVTLTGFGGGATISCAPSALAFGTVAANIGGTLPVICTNGGTDVPGHPEAGLTISTMPSTNPVFSGTVDPASPAQPLPAGQSLQIDIAYSPTMTSTDVGVLTINSNVTDGIASLVAPTVSLSGDAIAEQPCSYSVTPLAVNFGQVKPNSTVTSGFTITNLGQNECLVTGLNLTAGTSTAFVLASGSVNSQRLSPAGTTPPGQYPSVLQVNIQFTPRQIGSYTGAVDFTISNPASPHQTVDLAGVGGNSCFLLQPSELDFGTVGLSNGQFCANGKRKFVGVNGCGQAVTVQSLTLDSAGGAYSLVSDSVPQTVAQGSTSAPFEVGFAPTSAGNFSGSVLVQTDLQSTPFGVGLTGTAVNGDKQTDKFQGHTPSVDVLLVMDSDDDLEDLRQPFALHVGDFVNAALNLGLDFQFGVTSSSDCPGTRPNGEQGRLVPCPSCDAISGPTPTIVTPSDPNAATDLANLVLLNSEERDQCQVITDDEHFFDVTYKALVIQAQNYNYGFIRPDAYLAVIATNGDNEDEQDPNPPAWYANQFLSVKGADHPELFSWSYINPSEYGSSGGSTPFNLLPERIKSMLNLVGGVALDMTQQNWWKGVVDLWNIVLASTTRFPLSGTPDPTTIQVYLDGPPPDQAPPGVAPGVQVLAANPNGSINWSYDSVANSLDINASTFSLTSTDQLYVEYTIVCN